MDLPSEFVIHAALEVYAMWSLYTTLTTVKLPERVTSSTSAGTPVIMYAPDGRTIARGVIALDRPASFNGVNVTQSRVIMIVQEVYVPGYLISPTLSSSQVLQTHINFPRFLPIFPDFLERLSHLAPIY
jgi:hypothetical protein